MGGSSTSLFSLSLVVWSTVGMGTPFLSGAGWPLSLCWRDGSALPGAVAGGWLARKESNAAEPGPHLGGGARGLFALDGEALAEGGAAAGGGVVPLGRAEPAHRVGGDGVHGLAAEVEGLGERRHDHGCADVPDRAGEQHRGVVVDRGERVGDDGPGIGLLLADVAGDRRVVVGGARALVGGGVGARGLDAVDVAVDEPADDAGQALGVSDLEVPPPAVVV